MTAPPGSSALAALALLASLSCQGGRSSAAPTGLLVVTLDTTRADHLSVYGYMDLSLPHLERLAASGVVFDQAMSVGALTLPAHTSLFTGLLPPAHGVRDNGGPGLADSHVTLAEILRGRGFQTAAFIGSVVLDADRGLSQGFDRYGGVGLDSADARGFQRRGDEVIDEAVDWLAGVGSAPFFLWAHLYDPHRPYTPPSPYDAMHDPYVGEIAFVDQQIGRLLAMLDARGLTGRTIVVIAGDHGEARGEHGERDHGVFLYQSVLRVPLIVRVPGIRPRRIADVVRLTDIMPTVLDLLGLPVPRSDGATLAGALHGHARPVEREAYAESLYPRHLGWSPVFALRSGRYKLVDAPRPELYDLEADPFEEHNIYSQRLSVAAAMTDRVNRMRSAADATSASRELEPSPGLRRRLSALGYASGTRDRSARRPDRLPDAKDCIAASPLGSTAVRTASPSPCVTPAIISERTVDLPEAGMDLREFACAEALFRKRRLEVCGHGARLLDAAGERIRVTEIAARPSHAFERDDRFRQLAEPLVVVPHEVKGRCAIRSMARAFCACIIDSSNRRPNRSAAATARMARGDSGSSVSATMGCATASLARPSSESQRANCCRTATSLGPRAMARR